ncbi:MAG: hypothetical protein H6595_11670 [Flavobacteriales bacterium]|nr:hypothetical protein [Flavobacteriales bacterium]
MKFDLTLTAVLAFFIPGLVLLFAVLEFFGTGYLLQCPFESSGDSYLILPLSIAAFVCGVAVDVMRVLFPEPLVKLKIGRAIMRIGSKTVADAHRVKNSPEHIAAVKSRASTVTTSVEAWENAVAGQPKQKAMTAARKAIQDALDTMDRVERANQDYKKLADQHVLPAYSYLLDRSFEYYRLAVNSCLATFVVAIMLFWKGGLWPNIPAFVVLGIALVLFIVSKRNMRDQAIVLSGFTKPD